MKKFFAMLMAVLFVAVTSSVVLADEAAAPAAPAASAAPVKVKKAHKTHGKHMKHKKAAASSTPTVK